MTKTMNQPFTSGNPMVPYGSHGMYPTVPPPPAQIMGTAPVGVTGGDPTMLVGSLNKVFIKEKMNLGEAIADAAGCCFLQENEYDIFDSETGRKVLEVKEKSGCCWRFCCGPHHKLRMDLIDPATASQVMTIDRPFKCHSAICPAFCNMCRHEASLYMGTDVENKNAILGYTKVPTCGGCCTPTVGVHLNDQKVPFSYIEGPACCFGGCWELCCNEEFPISTTTGKGQDIGVLVKEKPDNRSQLLLEVLTDADVYSLTFQNPAMTPQQKTVLLSSALLLDYLYFETGKPWDCDWWECSCSIILCNWYMCGMMWPCKIELCNKDDMEKAVNDNGWAS